MRLMLIGIALCCATPTLAVEFPPEISSFAYLTADSSPVVPFDYAIALLSKIEERSAPVVGAAPSGSLGPQPFSKSELCSTVAFEAAANNLPVRFFANLIEQESSFNPHVVSSKGAQGIAQFMPGTAAEQGLINPFDPIQAISASAKFLANLIARFGNIGLAAAAYNAGPQRVSDWLARQGSGSLPAETQHYVRKITGLTVEEWALPVSKADEFGFPPHAECPQFRTAGSNTFVKTRMAALDTGGYRGRLRRTYPRPRLSALTYVVLSPSVAKSAPNEFTKYR